MTMVRQGRSTLARLLLASPKKQFERVNYVLHRFGARIYGEPNPFPNINMTREGDIFRGEDNVGFSWFVVKNDPSLVSWAKHFIALRARFEDRNLLRPGDVVINVGACTGEYTTYAAQEVGSEGRVIAFEPDPAHFACLAANMKMLQHTNVDCVNAAISDEPGEVRLHRIETAMAGGSVDQGYLEEFRSRITSTITVPCHSLDQYFAIDSRGVRAIVVTVNNHELEVLRGAERLLERTDYVIYQSIHHRRIKAFLGENGFVPVQEVYAGPEGRDEEYISLFSRQTL